MVMAKIAVIVILVMGILALCARIPIDTDEDPSLW